MAEHKLAASNRTEFGKGASRRLRRSGAIPAVLYGHGTDPVHVSLPGHDTMLILRQANVLITLSVEGDKDILALPKQVQRDPITNFVEHVDLLIVKKGEKVTVDVPLTFVGEVAEKDSLVNTELNSLSVLAPATDIPAEIEVSLEGLVVGDQITVGDLKLPEGVETAVDPEQLVVGVVPPPVVVLETEDEAAEGAEAEAAEDEAAEDAEADE